MSDTAADPAAEAEPLAALLDHLKQARAFDFSGYKRTSLERRIRKRMEAIEVGDYAEYVDYLELHPEEYAQLFDALLINVTSFFRDPAAWDHLAKEVIPRMLERKSPESPLRIWSAGCASGQEAYTVAIVLAEALGVEAFLSRVKIYATDVDEDALALARNGTYAAKQVDRIPPPLLERYFERTDHRCTFRKDLRRAIIFGRNDLVQDAPISRIDLLVCRNTLMYFNAETQARILGRFNFALDPDGVLFLGRSEMLITHSGLFTPVSLKSRLFAKMRKATLRDRLLHATSAEGDRGHGADADLRQGSFDALPVAQLVMDADAMLVLVNRRAAELFELGPDGLGRPLRELGVSYHPIELIPAVEQALADRRPVTLGPATWSAGNGETVELEAQVTPVLAGTAVLGVSVAYVDVTAQQRLREEVAHGKRELETAYEELQSTVEELETTNEELQSTNEELETTNEELQSTVEELETTNEELQSTNEELETINDELRERTVELNEVNTFLETILTSLGVAVVVLDRNGQIDVWNAHAQELWGLRQEEVAGQHFLALDIGLPVEQLKQPIRQALEQADFRSVATLPATTRRGKAIACEVSCLPLTMHDGEVTGAILLMKRVEPAKA